MSNTNDVSMTSELNRLFRRTYGFMMLALASTAISMFVFATTFGPAVVDMISQSSHGLMIPTIGFIVIQFALIFVINGLVSAKNVNTVLATVALLAFSIVEGIPLAIVTYVSGIGPLVAAFLSASGLFGVMAIIGYTTKKDLSGFGPILMGTLIAGLIVSVINIVFIQASLIQTILSLVMIVLFAGWTAYDNQLLKVQFSDRLMSGANEKSLTGIAISGALSLYLDFINLLLNFLSLFSNNR